MPDVLVAFSPSICFVEQKIWSYQWLMLRMGISKFCFLYLIIVLLSKKLGRVGLMSIFVFNVINRVAWPLVMLVFKLYFG